MIIDFHSHQFPDDLAEKAVETVLDSVPTMTNALNGTLSDLKKSMVANNIAKSITLPVATKPTQVDLINKSVIELNEESIIPFGSLHPETDDFIVQITNLKNSNIKGVKLHPEYQQFMADDKKMNPIYEELSSAGLIVLFHAGKDPWPIKCKGAYPQRIKNVVNNFPNLKVVAAHMGGWEMWDEVFETLAGESLYFDTSAVQNELNSELFIKILTKHGSNRILYGSDSPWFSHQSSIEYIDKLPLSSAQKDQIFYKNAEEFLQL